MYVCIECALQLMSKWGLFRGCDLCGMTSALHDAP